MSLTRRENLLEALRCGNPEWLPIVTHVDPYNQPSRKGMPPELAETLGAVKWQGENTLALSRYLEIDVLDYVSAPVSIRREKVVVEAETEGADTVQTWRTPKGDLRCVRRRNRDGNASYLVEHLVKSADDLPALAAVFEDEIIEPDAVRIEAVKERKRRIGDDGLLMCFLPGTPLGMMYRVFSGVAPLAYLHVDAPAALRDLFDVMERNYLERFRVGLAAGADAYVGMDDTSTTTISPAMFEQYNLDVTDRRAELCHEAGRLYFHHSCGLIRDLLPLYRRTKMDVVHAFTPPPTGDVTIPEGRRLLGDRIAICGSLGLFADEPWSLDKVRREIRDVLSVIGSGDGVVVSLAAFPNRTVEQMRQVVAALRRTV